MPDDRPPSPRPRRWSPGDLGLLIVALLVVVGLFLILTAEPGTLSEGRPLDRVEVVDEGLVLHWSGLPCESVDRERTEVIESADEVRVTLYVDTPLDGCPGGDTRHTTEVALAEPPGERDIVDGACSLAAYAGDPRC